MQPIYSTSVGFEVSKTCLLAHAVLEPSTCATVIEGATRSLGSTAVDYPPSYRDNDRTMFDDHELARVLFERVRSILPAELATENGPARLVGLNHRFRICRYRNGQSFRIHQDGAHRNGDVRSRLTLQIYLDERFEGGKTRFYDARRGAPIGAVVPRTGTAIVFDHELWHDGEPVTSGTKHVLRTDVLYAEPTALTGDDDDRGVLRGHDGYVFALAALSDGSLASGSRDRTVVCWAPVAPSPEGGFRLEQRSSEHAASVTAIVEGADGAIVTASRDRTVRSWDRRTGASRKLADLDGAGLSLARTSSGVACGSADGTITLLAHSTEEQPEKRTLVGHTGWVWCVASLPDGRLVSGSEDGTIRAWNVATCECLASATPGRGPVHALAALPDGRIAAGFADGHVIVYELGRVFAPVSVYRAHDGEIYALSALGDDLLASGGEDCVARVFRIGDRAELASARTNGFVRAIAPTKPHGDQLAIASYDGTIRLVPAPVPRRRRPRGAMEVSLNA
jgi:WD40 repeat protein